jgi:predicted metal-dependent enzyme (double-stranded beta helix superfamily)
MNSNAFIDSCTVASAAARHSIHVRPIHDDIIPRHICDPTTTVRYLHVREVDGRYSLGIFVFPPHAKIPLHDHPGMCVISRLLYGSIKRLSLDLARNSAVEIDRQESSAVSSGKRRQHSGMLSWWPWWTTIDGRLDPGDNNRHTDTIRKYGKWAHYQIESVDQQDRCDSLLAPECTVLYPWEGNVHEFTAGPDGAAILDVLLPPYDAEHDRDCTFYEIVDGSTNAADSDYKIPVDRRTGNTSAGTYDKSNEQTAPESCWIVPIQQPNNFHCVGGEYREFGRD